MTRQELEEALKELNIPKNSIRLEGTPSDYSVCIDEIETPGEPKKWEVYYVERGGKCDPILFDHEEDAYNYLYSIAKKDRYAGILKDKGAGSFRNEKTEDQYTTTVKVRKILQGKPLQTVCILLGLWLFLILASLCFLRVTPYAALVILVLFLSIIPIIIVIRRITKPYSGAQSFQNEEVTFRAVDGVLYKDDVKLDVACGEDDESIYVEDIHVYSGIKYYLTGTYKVSYIGVVEKPYAEGYMKYLKEQGIAIADYN